MHIKFWLEILKERDNLEDLDVSRSIILEWILGKQDGKLTGFFGMKLWTSGKVL